MWSLIAKAAAVLILLGVVAWGVWYYGHSMYTEGETHERLVWSQKEQAAATEADAIRASHEAYVNSLSEALLRAESVRSEADRKLESSSIQQANKTLPSDDSACDLPPELFKYWESANKGGSSLSSTSGNAGVSK